jgi:linoleoyl-CoA desaturase
VKYPPHSPLRAALNERVQAYFQRTGKRQVGGVRIWVKSALILAWLAASYALLMFWASTWWQVVPLTISLGLATAGVGFNIQHDGGHGSFSRRKAVNRMTALSLNLIGGSSYFWNFKHNVIHHQFTNIEGVDADIEAEPFLRLAPGQRRHWYHRFQHYYVWGLLVFFPPKWGFVDDFLDLARGRVGMRRVPRPRGVELLTFIGSKLVYFGLAVALPFALHPWLNVLLVWMLFSLVLGVVLATVFQLAHCVQEADFCAVPAANQRMPRCWVEHQLATTVDFSPRNRLLAWYLGGLNYQVEHHLFPRVSHVHYPALAPIVRQVCSEQGVRYLSHASLWGALRSHVRWLRLMGRPQAV